MNVMQRTSSRGPGRERATLEGVSDLLTLLSLLKGNKRTGWFLRGVPHVESIADHMWRMAVSVLLFEGGERKLDHGEAALIALVHDIAEGLVGDFAPGDNVNKGDKQVLEAAAVRTLRAAVGWNSRPGMRLQQLWEAYEHQSTPEGRFVKDLDKLEMIATAAEYEAAHGMRLGEFFDGVVGKLGSPEVAAVAAEVTSHRPSLPSTAPSSPRARSGGRRGAPPRGAVDSRAAWLPIRRDVVDSAREGILGPEVADALGGDVSPAYRARLKTVLESVQDRYRADIAVLRPERVPQEALCSPVPPTVPVTHWVPPGRRQDSGLGILVCTLVAWGALLLCLWWAGGGV